MNFIKKIINNFKQKSLNKKAKMKNAVISALEKFYLDLEQNSLIVFLDCKPSSGSQSAAQGVDFMPCIKARQAYEETIKSDKDLIRAYKNLLKAVQ